MKNFDDNFSKDTELKIVHVRVCAPNNIYTYLCWDKDNKFYYWGTKDDTNLIFWKNSSRASSFLKVMIHSSLFEPNNSDYSYYNVYYNYDLNSINNQNSRRPLWEIS